MQFGLAQGEWWDFGCITFIDYWLGQNSVPLGTHCLGGNLIHINIRRGYNQGWGALTRNQLGRSFRAIEREWDLRATNRLDDGSEEDDGSQEKPKGMSSTAGGYRTKRKANTNASEELGWLLC
jgi:hypothetical protein